MANKERAKLIEWIDNQINKCSKTIERYQKLGEPYKSLVEEICIEIEYFKDIKSELNMVCDKIVWCEWVSNKKGERK